MNYEDIILQKALNLTKKNLPKMHVQEHKNISEKITTRPNYNPDRSIEDPPIHRRSSSFEYSPVA